jgi:hypothetical protein
VNNILTKNGVILAFLLSIAVLAGYNLVSSLHLQAYKTSITVGQIPETLGTSKLPALPKEWEIQAVEKYDDGFISPSVTIAYSNGAVLRLSASQWDLSKEFLDRERVNIGGKRIAYYFNDKEAAYVFNGGLQINYAIVFPKQLQGEVEKMILAIEA